MTKVAIRYYWNTGNLEKLETEIAPEERQWALETIDALKAEAENLRTIKLGDIAIVQSLENRFDMQITDIRRLALDGVKRHYRDEHNHFYGKTSRRAMIASLVQHARAVRPANQPQQAVEPAPAAV